MSQKSKRVLKVFSQNFIEIFCLATILFSMVLLGYCLRNSINLRQLFTDADKSEITEDVPFKPIESRWNSETGRRNVNEMSTKKQCQPPPPRDNCYERYNRVSDSMCCEYIWEMNHKDAVMKYNKCSSRNYWIIGGRDSSPGEFPHMAALGWELKEISPLGKYEFFCGGSLISNRFVVTAAHCTYKTKADRFKSPKPVMVRLGTDNIGYENYKRSKNVQDKKIEEIFKHRYYKAPKKFYDIALVKLASDVIFTKTVHPACISTSFLTSTSTTVNVTGWGVTQYLSIKTSDQLQVATLDITNRRECREGQRRSYSRNWKYLADHQFCAFDASKRKDTCQGDSGGPIQKRIDTTSGMMHTVLGVTSMGKRCADSPGFYTNITNEKILPWIESTVWGMDFPRFRK